jgi:hypothetical protein
MPIAASRFSILPLLTVWTLIVAVRFGVWQYSKYDPQFGEELLPLLFSGMHSALRDHWNGLLLTCMPATLPNGVRLRLGQCSALEQSILWSCAGPG